MYQRKESGNQLNKDQFWKIIDNINQSGPFADEDGYKECVLNALFPCSFEDLLDWDHIMTQYEKALNRRQLYEKFNEGAPHFSRKGFDEFRFCLIARGKEAYFNVLRDPELVKCYSAQSEFSQWQGHYLHFVADRLYGCKHQLYHNGEYGLLFMDVSKHPLSDQTMKEIQEELQREAPLPPPPIIERPQSPSNIADLVNSGNCLFAHVEDKNDMLEYVFFNTPANIAHFLGNYSFADSISIYDTHDNWLLSADGPYIWDCEDDQLWTEIEKTLIPIQWREVKPEPFFCPTFEKVQMYLTQQINMNEQQERMHLQMKL